ncbi:zf-HC2 domain-containing protein [Micromonospora sp. NPDC049559]|uniref:zf-HC2 domain-containing protein n=1 Tax=Micromonospora sp. NPDC049559 TaxID=3155923 RepID=UPI00341E3C57
MGFLFGDLLLAVAVNLVVASTRHTLVACCHRMAVTWSRSDAPMSDDSEGRGRLCADCGAYLLGALPLAAVFAFEEHLAGCESCRDLCFDLGPVVSGLSRMRCGAELLDPPEEPDAESDENQSPAAELRAAGPIRSRRPGAHRPAPGSGPRGSSDRSDPDRPTRWSTPAIADGSPGSRTPIAGPRAPRLDQVKGDGGDEPQTRAH